MICKFMFTCIKHSYINMSKYIHILDNLSHDEKLIIDSQIPTKAMSIKYILSEADVLISLDNYHV